ncbi:hypothetical protein V6N13_068920 [Hibiscus sabdariffa]
MVQIDGANTISMTNCQGGEVGGHADLDPRLASFFPGETKFGEAIRVGNKVMTLPVEYASGEKIRYMVGNAPSLVL